MYFKTCYLCFYIVKLFVAVPIKGWGTQESPMLTALIQQIIYSVFFNFGATIGTSLIYCSSTTELCCFAKVRLPRMPLLLRIFIHINYSHSGD